SCLLPLDPPSPSVGRALSLRDALPICIDMDGVRTRYTGSVCEVNYAAGAPRAIERACQGRADSTNAVCAERAGDVPIVVQRWRRSEEHTSELQSREKLVCRRLLAKKKR